MGDSVEQIRITYVYDKQSRVIEHRTASEIAPSAGGSVQYIYDAQGCLIQKNYFDHRGEPKDQAFFEYDTLGRVIKEESSTLVSRYIYNEDNSGYILWEEGKGTSYTNKTERLFDDAGNCIAVRNYEGDEIASEIVYEYNERNEEIKKSTYVYGVLKQYIVREYRDGKEIRTLVYRSGKLEGVSEFFYNRFGECVGGESVDADGKLIQSFTCEYDYVGS